MPTLDMNCDMGESFGAWHMGNDLAILDQVTSANIACGFHAGDPDVMLATVRAAAARGVAVGAHPGLPDLQGFGRRIMALKPEEVYSLVVYQIGALQAFTKVVGVPMQHVKTHGALFSMTGKDFAIAEAVAQAVADVDPTLKVYVSNPNAARAAEARGLSVVYEVYSDRSYQDNGTITPRGQAHAMIEDVDQSIAQVRQMVHQGSVTALSGHNAEVRADTLCIHGDQPGALVFAQRIRSALEADGVTITAPSR